MGFIGLLLAPKAHTFPRGEGGPATAGSEEERRQLKNRKKPDTEQKYLDYCPHSSSVSLTLDSFPPGEAKAPYGRCYPTETTIPNYKQSDKLKFESQSTDPLEVLF